MLYHQAGVEFFLEDYDFNADDQFQVEDGDGMFCMRIATPSVPRESGSDDLLILRRKHGLIVTFERIGLMFVETQKSEFYQMFEENINNREDCAITFV